MRRVAAIAAAAAAVAVSIPAVQHLREEPPPSPPAVRLSLTAPTGTELGAGDEPLDAAISPDQRELVFVAMQIRRSAADQPPSGATRLWRRRLDAPEAEPILGTDGARLPAWKQTGNVLSFFADSRLKLLNLKTGGITDVTEAPAPAGAAWLRDGSLLFVPAPGPIRRMLDGRVTDATRLAAGDTAHVFPVTSRGGEDFTYVSIRSGQRMVRLNAGGQETDLGTTDAHAALPDPRWFLFVKGTTLLGDYRDADGRMTGRDLPLVLDVGTTQRGRGLFVASADLLLYARAAERPRRIIWLDMSGAQVGAVADVGDYWQVRVSPDDRNLAVTTRDPLLRSLDVMNIPVDEASPTFRLSTSIATDTDPVWSPDGRQVSFRSMHRGRPEVFVTPATIRRVADGQSSAVPVNTTGELLTDWHGREMLVQRQGRAGFDLERVHETTRATRPVADTPFNETDGRWSPDGRWIAYVSDEPGRPDIFIQTERGERQRVSSGGGTHPRWTRDSRALLFLRGSTVMRSELLAGGTRFGPPRPLFDAPGIRDFDVARRSDRIVALLPVSSDSAAQASVVLNWQSLLRQAAP